MTGDGFGAGFGFGATTSRLPVADQVQAPRAVVKMVEMLSPWGAEGEDGWMVERC